MFQGFSLLNKTYLKHLFTMLLLFLGVLNLARAQDPVFTQFYSNPVYLNPAFSGTNKCPRLVSNYRDQWPGFSGNFITTAVAYDQGFDALKGGFGLVILSDQIAKTLKSTEVSLAYSYHQNVSRTFTINYGIQGTYIQKSVDRSNLTFGDMIHPRRGFVFSTSDIISAEPVNMFDFSAGIIGYSEKFYIGFAAHHLTEPNETFLVNSSNEGKLSRRYTVHMGTDFSLSSHSLYSSKEETLSPSILYSRQGEFQQLNLGLYYKKGAYVLGFWYRNRDSFIVTLGLETQALRIGYSYDITTSQLSLYSGGSHEISLAIKFYCKPKKKVYRTMSCPSF